MDQSHTKMHLGKARQTLGQMAISLGTPFSPTFHKPLELSQCLNCGAHWPNTLKPQGQSLFLKKVSNTYLLWDI